MDYSIGSVADLISGSTTPNKQKVVKKQFKNKTKSPATEPEEADSVVIKVKKAKKRSFSPQIKQSVSDEDTIDQQTNKEEEVLDGVPKKKIKKKKLKSSKIDLVSTPSTNDSAIQNDDVKNNEMPEESKEEGSKHTNTTTIFVGNLPITLTHKKLVKMFCKYGTVLNARIRSIPVADPKVPKKVAAIKKQFHPERKSVHGYVT